MLNFSLLNQITARDIGSRYKGSMLGVLWALITPLFLLLIYTLVFGSIFNSRWPQPSGEAAAGSLAEFAIILFTGLIVFQLFSDSVGRSSTVILDNKTYVTRVVFPLEILPLSLLGSALFQFALSFIILFVAAFITFGSVPLTVLLVPVIVAPLCLNIIGFSLVFAGIGTYFRDITQILGTVISALMFLAPIFFSRSIMPSPVKELTLWNPLTIPVEQLRKVLVWGQWPDWSLMGIYTGASLLILIIGIITFQKLRRGFADVI